MKKKRLLGILLSFALMLTMMPVMVLSQTAYATLETVNYLEGSWDQEKGECAFTENSTDSYTVVEANSTAWGAGTYVVNSEVTISGRITVNGTAKLILCDGAELTASKGITVEGTNNALNIYPGSTAKKIVGSGQLIASAENNSYNAAIGSAGNGSGGAPACGTVTIHGGKVDATTHFRGAGIGGGNYGAGGTVTIYGGKVTATSNGLGAGIGGGCFSAGGTVTIYGGEVTATSTVSGLDAGAGIGGGYDGAGADVSINGGKVTATGGKGAIGIGAGAKRSNDGNLGIGSGVKLEISTDGEEWTEPSGELVRTRYMRAEYISHKHSFTYSASGATITATCANTDGKCPLDDGTDQHNHTATLTIAAPLHVTYGDNYSPNAQTTDANSIKGSAEPSYFEATKTGDTYTKKSDTALSGAPTNAGDYIAEITLGEANGSHATASVGYTIAKANPTATAPTATATFGQTLADVTLTNPSGNTPGSWAWADSTQSVGDVVTPAASFKANFTPTDSDNYNSVSNVDVTVTVEKAAARDLFNLLIDHTYTKTDFSQNIRQNMPSDAGTLTYQVGNVTKTGNVTASNWAIDANYNLTATFANGTVDDKVTVPVTIKSTNYADSTFKVIIALTDKQPAVVTTLPGAKTLTANGSAQELVTAGEAEGGTMQYALGEDGDNAPTDGWGEDIPTGTEVGDYYVWYMAKGDATHSDTTPNFVKSTISKAEPTPTPSPSGGAVQQVIDKINALPNPEDVTINDEAKIKEAREAFDKLSDKDKSDSRITPAMKDKLMDCEDQLAKAKKSAEDQKAADEVKAIINALPDPSKATSDQVSAAVEAFNSLTPDQKNLITEGEVAKLQKALNYPAKMLKAKMKSVKALKGRKAVAKWGKKSGANGYQLYYKAKGVKAKKANINSAKTLKKTVKKLKAGKTYSFKVRTFTKVQNLSDPDKTIKVYGKWSKVKSCKAKK